MLYSVISFFSLTIRFFNSSLFIISSSISSIALLYLSSESLWRECRLLSLYSNLSLSAISSSYFWLFSFWDHSSLEFYFETYLSFMISSFSSSIIPLKWLIWVLCSSSLFINLCSSCWMPSSNFVSSWATSFSCCMFNFEITVL